MAKIIKKKSKNGKKNITRYENGGTEALNKNTVFVVQGYHPENSPYSCPRIIGVFQKKEEAKKALEIFKSKLHDSFFYKDFSINEYILDNLSTEILNYSKEQEESNKDLIFYVSYTYEHEDGCEDVIQLGAFSSESKAYEKLLQQHQKSDTKKEFIEYCTIDTYVIDALSWKEGYFTTGE